jgi:hypothetical protein
MKTLMGKILAVGGACALFGTASIGAFAQDYGYHRWHRDGIRVERTGFRTDGDWSSIRRMRRELSVLHSVYDHEIRSGHPAAAMRAHMRAERIRERIHEMRGDIY